MEKLTRAQLRNDARKFGVRGVKSKNKAKDGFQNQLELFMKYFGDYGRDKTIEEIREGFENFLNKIRSDFIPEVFEELIIKTEINIKNKEDKKLVKNIIGKKKTKLF